MPESVEFNLEGVYERGSFTFDLEGFSLQVLNDLLIDISVEVAKRAHTRPTEILKSAIKTAPAGY